MFDDDVNDELPADRHDHLRQLVTSYIDIFCTSFLPGTPSRVDSMRIELTSEAQPTHVRVQNYSQGQKDSLRQFVALVATAGIAYINPSAAWACALLLVHKAGLALFGSTIDLRPVNRFTVEH